MITPTDMCQFPHHSSPNQRHGLVIKSSSSEIPPLALNSTDSRWYIAGAPMFDLISLAHHPLGRRPSGYQRYVTRQQSATATKVKRLRSINRSKQLKEALQTYLRRRKDAMPKQRREAITVVIELRHEVGGEV